MNTIALIAYHHYQGNKYHQTVYHDEKSDEVYGIKNQIEAILLSINGTRQPKTVNPNQLISLGNFKQLQSQEDNVFIKSKPP